MAGLVHATKQSHKRKKLSPLGSPVVSTQNQYDALSDLDSEDEVSQPATQNKKSTIPPIIVDGQFKDHKKVMSELKSTLKGEFTSKVSRVGKTILKVNNSADHKVAMSYLESKYEFHSYSLKEDLQPAWVLNGLPKSVSADEVKSDLTEKGLTVVKVKCISKPENEYPLYSITFDSKTEVKSILAVKNVCYCIVSWSKFKNKSEVTQCFRCMKYGHIGKNCRREQKCLKCAGKHVVRECTVDQMRCANCGEEHMANEKNCADYMKNVEMKKKSAIPPTRQYRSSQSQRGLAHPSSTGKRNNFPSLPQRSGPGDNINRINQWSQLFTQEMMNQPQTSSQQNPASVEAQDSNPNGSNFFHEMKDLLKFVNIPKIMLFIKVLSAKLKQTQDTFSKIIIVIESIFQFVD